MVKRFVATALVLAFALVCLLPANNVSAAGTSGGISLFTRKSSQSDQDGIIYKLDWSNIIGVKGELETEYVMSR